MAATHADVKELSHLLLVIQISILQRLIFVEVMEKGRKASDALSVKILGELLSHVLPKGGPRAIIIEGQRYLGDLWHGL